jgi:putative glutamine amidotransferase
MTKSPTIGISGITEAMLAKIRDAGGNPVFFGDHHARAADNDITSIAAFVVMGNDLDIDPDSYIHRYPDGDPRRRIHPETKNECLCPNGKARAGYEELMIKKALAAKMPLLGICGGMHRINVLLGGTLHQHVPDMVGHDKLLQKNQGIPPNVATLPVVITCGTKMAMIARDIKMSFVSCHAPDMPKVVMENSLRHQSIDMLGKGLIASSLSDAIRLPGGSAKYLIEAIEPEPHGPFGQQFLIGVQWHPEFGASPLGPKIVQHLVEAARQYAGKAKKTG